MHNNRPILVIAHAARMLAQMARACDIRCITVDLCSDQDTQQMAFASYRVAQLHGAEFQACVLSIKRNHAVTAVLVGSGFEQFPDSLCFLYQHFEIIGTQPEVSLQLVDTRYFFEQLKAHRIAFPSVAFNPPDNLNGWLYKTAQSCGGINVFYANDNLRSLLKTADGYWQTYLNGKVCSVLFLANGSHYQVIGINELLVTQIEQRPFMFAGVIGNIQLANDIVNQVCHSLEGIMACYALQGLCSMDFIVVGNQVYVLEVNARIPASAQLYAPDILLAHIAGYQGHLDLSRWSGSSYHKALKVVYAEQTIQIPDTVSWPDWVADRPESGATISQNQPLCSIIVDYVNAIDAENALQHYQRQLTSILLSGA